MVLTTEAGQGSPALIRDAGTGFGGRCASLALLEKLASKHAAAATGEAGKDLWKAMRSIPAATEWASGIRAVMDALQLSAEARRYETDGHIVARSVLAAASRMVVGKTEQ